MSDLDKIKTNRPIKDYDLKVLKAKSNPLVAKALELMEQFMNDPNATLKDKASMGFKVIQNHIVLLDKEEKLEFIKLNKANAVLRNNMLLKQSLEASDGYQKAVETEEDNDNFDLGLEFLKQGDTAKMQ